MCSDRELQLTNMTRCSFLFTFATVSNLVILFSVTNLSDGQLTFNPSAKTGEDWSLTSQKRSPQEFVPDQSVRQSADTYQKWPPGNAETKTETPLILELILKQLEKYSEEDLRNPEAEKFMMIQGPSSPLKVGKRDQRKVSRQTFPGAKYRHFRVAQ